MTRLYVDLSVGREVLSVGVADSTVRRGRLSTTFRYAEAFVSGPRTPVAPGWNLARRTVVSEGLPGIFADSAPDRWGRLLVSRRERREAADQGRSVRSLTDLDHLLGVDDETRQGALRFRITPSGPHVASSGGGVPTTIELPALLAAADSVSRDPDDWSAVKGLLAAGSASLGGARPKASVRDGERLLIAKFPHPDDDWDVMAWEKTALDLAEAAGLPVPQRRLVTVDGRSVLLVERFDRRDGDRVGYASAMTMLETRDGTASDYLDLLDPLTEHGARPTEDVWGLWRRVAFNAAISNVDDHMRNHGFLQVREGWTWSPVFDVNPHPEKRDRVSAFDGRTDRDGTFDALVRNADLLGATHGQVETLIDHVVAAVAGWREVARRNGVTPAEVLRFEPAFAG